MLNHDDTDDVLQNVFIKVYRNIASFKGDSKLYTWLYRIATNESLTFIKKRSRRLQISDEKLQNQMLQSLESDVYFEGDHIQLQLQKAIARLPEQQRLIFNMKYFSEHTFQDMSVILDISVGGLKSSYHIAQKKIKEYLTTHETL